MQISKPLLVAAVSAAIAIPSLSGAADNDAQVKAREAMRQKLLELPTAPAAVPAPEKPAPAAAPAPASAPKAPVKTPARPVAPAAPAVSAPAPVATPAQAPARADSEAIARAREAVRQKLGELDSPASARAAAPPAASASTAGTNVAPGTPAPQADTDKLTQAREEMRRKMNQVERTAPAAPVTAPRGQRQTQAPILPPPPSTLSSDKQQKLTELLQRYRNDELSPEEYHRERQKLLSAP